MVQNIVQLPEYAKISIGEWTLTVTNHRVVSSWGLLHWLLQMIARDSWDDAVEKLKNNGFSYEGTIEYCVAELETDTYTFLQIIYWYFEIKKKNDPHMFYTTEDSAAIVDEFIEKLRGCDDWIKLYDIMVPGGEFYKHIRDQINTGVNKTHVVYRVYQKLILLIKFPFE